MGDENDNGLDKYCIIYNSDTDIFLWHSFFFNYTYLHIPTYNTYK